MLPLLHEKEEKATQTAQEAMEEFPALFRRHWTRGMRAKLGLFTAEDEDATLAQGLLKLMQDNGADYTLTLRSLTGEAPAGAFFRDLGFLHWQTQWKARLARQHETLEQSQTLMRTHNPAIIPRNHRVEEALEAATLRNDFVPVKRLLAALSSPFEDRPEHAPYREPGLLDTGYRTFCGT